MKCLNSHCLLVRLILALFSECTKGKSQRAQRYSLSKPTPCLTAKFRMTSYSIQWWFVALICHLCAIVWCFACSLCPDPLYLSHVVTVILRNLLPIIYVVELWPLNFAPCNGVIPSLVSWSILHLCRYTMLCRVCILHMEIMLLCS